MTDRSARLAFILSLTDKVTAPMGKVKTSFSDLAQQGQKNITQMGLGLAGMVGAGVAITQSLEPALEMNRALGEVRSLSVAEDALNALNRKSLEFSVAYGENARDFVASAYHIEGAIKGLVGNQLATFTNASDVLAKATKADAGTMGTYVGTMYNLFKGQADAMGKGQWVETLAGQTATAVQLFRTSGEQIGEAFKSAGGLASTAGVSLAEQMAVLGTLGSTMDGGEAGGLYKSFFENVSGASEKLGMSFVDQQGKLLPMMNILDKLKGKFGDLSIEANGKQLRDAFGGEAARLITNLMGDTSRLKNGMEQLGNVRGLENAERMAKAMVDPWQQFGAAVQALRIAFGQSLIPILAPLMDRLVGIASTLTRWTQLFPNITRVIGIATLVVFGIIAAMSLLTLTVGMSKMVWLGLVTVWKVLTMAGLRSIAMFLYHTVMVIGFVAGLVLMVAWMGLVKGAMLLWQGAIWLVNTALLANPVTWIVIGIVALVAAVAAAIIYWDQWTSALLNSEAFKWVSGQLTALSEWFDSMGGWSSMASAAWDGIVNIFKQAINGLIEMLNKIPGVNIEAAFGDMPAAPELPGISAPTVEAPLLPQLVSAPQQPIKAPLMMANTPKMPASAMPTLNALQPQAQAPALVLAPVPKTPAPIAQQLAALEPPRQPPALVLASAPTEKAEQSQQRINGAVASLSPKRPDAVPRDGLLASIQNNNQTQNKGTHVENVNIHTGKQMNPLELEGMLAMAVGG
ncbi:MULTISPECIES: phage tail tape measure protein [Pseudomonas]|uniref:Phage tail tape measure protein n=1 Tax=Pseudomonas lactis TaxID=1615674 RepID=A0ABS9FWH1_9PSED|nr:MULTISPECIES: phage tail tape measure protein [Pseudomonas]MCF4973167.1 phage tail tape measure protein [Pseudomonas lactis]MCF5004074.1 phage tail tape measure protein [Pseudomonas lactis]MCF5008139.1 phage tail tape measure protein [Pseudomonas lactis]MCF5014930.1 phage tail tape measure protein [Pseudomonas lactis]MCF5021735.1 phage tail tape measure protein [Pseudomonas lactis]